MNVSHSDYRRTVSLIGLLSNEGDVGAMGCLNINVEEIVLEGSYRV